MATQKPKGWLDKFVSKVPKTFGNEVAVSDVTRVQPHGNYISVADSERKALEKEVARRQTSIGPASSTPTSDAMRQAAYDRIAQEKADAFTKKIAEGAQTVGGALELAAPFTGPLMPLVGGVGAGLGVGSGAYLAGKDALAGNYGSAAINAGFAGLDAAGFGALRNPAVKDFIQGADHISDVSQVVDLSNIPNQQIYPSTNSFLNEAIGAIFPRKVPVQNSIDAGNQWTKNWIDHPATQEKMLRDFDNMPDRTKQDYLEHSLNYEPNSKLYPLSEQAKDLAGIVWQGKTFKGGYADMMHANNSGVSYRHSWDPFFNDQNLIHHPRQGTWISRSPLALPKQIESTVVHENYHDWLRNHTLRESGQYSDILNSLQPDFVNHYKQWDALRKQGINPDDVMGQTNSYIGYLSDPTEIHARIGELRKKYKLTPSMHVTIHDIDKMRAGEQLKDNIVNKDFFNLFTSDRDAAHMFNRLWAAPAAIGAGAIATQNLPDAEPEQQRNGGQLDKYQPGGKVQAVAVDSSKNKKAVNQPPKQEPQLQRYYGPEEFENCQGAGCSKIATADIANTFGMNYGDLHPQDAWYRRASVLKNKGKEVWNPSMGNNYSGFRVGDLVSLDRSGDTYAKTASVTPGYTMADNEGNEHVGEYVGVNEKGIPLIKHGSEHGKIYVQPINDLFLPDAGPVTLKYKPQSAYRLAELENAEIKDKKFYTAPQKAIPVAMKNPSVKLTANEKKYIDAINANAGKQQQMFGLSPEEAKMINTLGYGVFHNESNAGNTSWKRLVAPKMIGSELAHAFGRDAAASLGDVQFKYDDAMYNADKSLSSVGKRMQNIGVRREGLSDWTHHRDNYNDEVNSVSALMSDYLDKFKNNPKYKYDAQKKTIFGDIPIDRALINIYHFGPAATKEKFLRNAKTYANDAMKHVNLLSYTGEAPKNISISKSPNAAAFMNAAKIAKRENGGWLDKYNDGGPIQENYNDASVSYPDNFVGEGTINGPNWKSPAWGGQFANGGTINMPTIKDEGSFNKDGAWVPNWKAMAAQAKKLGAKKVKTDQGSVIYFNDKWEPVSADDSNTMAMGGSMPGAVGFTYARTNSPAPSNGPYAKKTKASAQNGAWLDKAINKLYDAEDDITKRLGNPMQKATNIAKEASYKHLGSMDDPIDSYRHSMAGNYTSKAIQDKLYNIPLVSQAAGFVGANVLGAGHEISTLIGHAPEFGGDDDRPWLDKIKESGEDAFNNMVGAGVGSIPFMSAKQKSDLLLNMSLNNRLPDGHGQGNMYIKKKQNGGEMKFYQEGLDWKPKSISKNGSVIKDDMGQWNHPGEITEIGSNQITMQGVPYPVLGISDTGDTQMMYPNEEYQYEGSSVTEYPMMQQGGQLTKLDQLTNFTNYNTKQPGGWLDKYQD